MRYTNLSVDKKEILKIVEIVENCDQNLLWKKVILKVKRYINEVVIDQIHVNSILVELLQIRSENKDIIWRACVDELYERISLLGCK